MKLQLCITDYVIFYFYSLKMHPYSDDDDDDDDDEFFLRYGQPTKGV